MGYWKEIATEIQIVFDELCETHKITAEELQSVMDLWKCGENNDN